MTSLQAARRANLARLLNPRHIVFLGGERAGAAIRACQDAGYRGQMLAVHPRRREIEGVACVPALADLPLPPDAAFLGVPAGATVESLRTLSAMGAGGAVCYASGFAEMGQQGAALNAALLQASGELAVVGPNCFGIINYVNHGSLWSVAYPAGTPGGRGAAVIGQSGNVCINLSMNQRQVPFSWIISAGNQAVLGFEDYIDHLVDDPHVTCIGLFLEGIRDVPAFSAASLKALARGIPVIAFRVGVSELGAKLAASHTSSLAGQNELYDALFERLGILSTASVPQFLELLKTASLAPLPRGRRLAVFSSSGGDNGMAADFASAAGLELPQPNERQRAAVKALLPDYGQVSNPLDFTAGYWGAEKLLTQMFTDMLAEGYDQGLLVIDHPRPELGAENGKALEAMSRALATASRATGVPGAVASVNPESQPEFMRRYLIERGLLPLQGLHDAGAVLGRWADYAELRHALPRDGLPAAPLALAPLPAGQEVTLDEVESKARLAAFGLPVPAGRVASLAGLPAAAAAMAGPFALKAVSRALPHKTEAGGVALNLADGAAVLAAARAMQQAVAAHRPGLVVERFLLEPMAPRPIAELLVGVKRDPLFGLVLVIASGGVLVELLRDAARLLLPAGETAIEGALRRLKSWPLLQGFRGRPAGDVAAAVKAIRAVAAYAEANAARLLELDVNPLMVLPAGQGAIAVDALVVERG
jgi:acyl-CoA synthetase (NDP forming)